LSLATFTIACVAQSAFGATVATSRTVNYRVAMRLQNSRAVPFTGKLELRYDSHGIVNGIYRGDSARPDPAYGKYIPVSGGVSGKNLTLNFGATGDFRIQATVETNGELIGSGISRNNKRYAFHAIPVP
jgi:hypothetical protein